MKIYVDKMNSELTNIKTNTRNLLTSLNDKFSSLVQKTKDE